MKDTREANYQSKKEKNIGEVNTELVRAAQVMKVRANPPSVPLEARDLRSGKATSRFPSLLSDSYVR